MPVVFKYEVGQVVKIRLGKGRSPGQSHTIPGVVLSQISPARRGTEPRYAIQCARGGVITRTESKLIV